DLDGTSELLVGVFQLCERVPQRPGRGFGFAGADREVRLSSGHLGFARVAVHRDQVGGETGEPVVLAGTAPCLFRVDPEKGFDLVPLVRGRPHEDYRLTRFAAYL